MASSSTDASVVEPAAGGLSFRLVQIRQVL
jgi:hypothetical protein